MGPLTTMELQAFTNRDWHTAARETSKEVRSVLETVLAKKDAGSLIKDDLLLLAYTQGADLVGIVAAADQLREELVGDVITYVINRNINFTNICYVRCKFCAFCCGPNAPEAYLLSPEQIAEKAIEARERNATEVCIQGGLVRNLPPFYYRDVLRAVKKAAPRIHIHAFSPMEIIHGAALTGMSLLDYLLMLKDEGLGSIPGTSAEILNDEVRSVVSSNKLKAKQWEEVIILAHRCGIPTTSTMMYGHREDPAHWIDHLLLVRNIQHETGWFTEFVPLGFIHQNTRLFHDGLARPGATLREHLLVHALARIALAGAINNVQVSWVKLPRQVAQLCLQAGANDYGGTLMEENISRLAGADSAQYMSPVEFEQRIRELGRVPAQRNTVYTEFRFRGMAHAPVADQAQGGVRP